MKKSELISQFQNEVNGYVATFFAILIFTKRPLF